MVVVMNDEETNNMLEDNKFDINETIVNGGKVKWLKKK